MNEEIVKKLSPKDKFFLADIIEAEKIYEDGLLFDDSSKKEADFNEILYCED